LKVASSTRMDIEVIMSRKSLASATFNLNMLLVTFCTGYCLACK
jgi:hypothetical protein